MSYRLSGNQSRSSDSRAITHPMPVFPAGSRRGRSASCMHVYLKLAQLPPSYVLTRVESEVFTMKIKSLFAGNRKGVVFAVDTSATLHDFGARQMYPGRVNELVRQTGHFLCMYRDITPSRAAGMLQSY